MLLNTVETFLYHLHKYYYMCQMGFLALIVIKIMVIIYKLKLTIL